MRRGAFHAATAPCKNKVLWDRFTGRGPRKFRSAVADSGSRPRAKCGGVRIENRASLALSQMTAASLPKTQPPRISRWKQVVRTPPLGSLLARSRRSTLVGGNRPPRLGAAGPDPGFGSPPAGRNPLAAAPRAPPGRAIDAAAAPRRSARKEDGGNVECALPRPLLDRHTAGNSRDGGRSPDNRRDTPDEIL
jgi:hypothetical protein